MSHLFLLQEGESYTSHLSFIYPPNSVIMFSDITPWACGCLHEQINAHIEDINIYVVNIFLVQSFVENNCI